MKTSIQIITWLSAFILHLTTISTAQSINTYPGISWPKADPKTLGWSDEKLNNAVTYAQTLGPGGLA